MTIGALLAWLPPDFPNQAGHSAITASVVLDRSVFVGQTEVSGRAAIHADVPVELRKVFVDIVPAQAAEKRAILTLPLGAPGQRIDRGQMAEFSFAANTPIALPAGSYYAILWVHAIQLPDSQELGSSASARFGIQ